MLGWARELEELEAALAEQVVREAVRTTARRAARRIETAFLEPTRDRYRNGMSTESYATVRNRQASRDRAVVENLELLFTLLRSTLSYLHQGWYANEIHTYIQTAAKPQTAAVAHRAPRLHKAVHNCLYCTPRSAVVAACFRQISSIPCAPHLRQEH